MYTILDTETSSLQGGVVELAMLHIDENLEVGGYFHSLINPERPIEPGAFAVHGISDADVANKPTLSQVEKDLSIVTHACGHNVNFDLRMLGTSLKHEYSLCTLALSRQYIKGTTNHKLETLQRELNLPPQKSHSALGDCYTTLDLLRKIMPLAGVPLATLFKRQEKPKALMVMPFGKHKGVPMSRVPADYLAWLRGQSGLDKDLKYTLDMMEKLK